MASKKTAKKATAKKAPATKKKASAPKKKAPATNGSATKAATKKKAPAANRPPLKKDASGNVLLSGGNPQIPKGDGDAPVQAFIAASPGWKRDAARALDELIVRTVPNVRKAVRWNSPFYGLEGKGWFLSFHHFNKYIKVTFLRGALFQPPPPVESRDPNTRYVHIHENEPVETKELVDWIKQAAALPGDPLF